MSSCDGQRVTKRRAFVQSYMNIDTCQHVINAQHILVFTWRWVFLLLFINRDAINLLNAPRMIMTSTWPPPLFVCVRVMGAKTGHSTKLSRCRTKRICRKFPATFLYLFSIVFIQSPCYVSNAITFIDFLFE